MSSRKKPTAKKTTKHPRFSLNSFRNDDANMAYIDHYKKASIVLERSVDIESLRNTFIPEVFKERTWSKLLNPMGRNGNGSGSGRVFPYPNPTCESALKTRTWPN